MSGGALTVLAYAALAAMLVVIEVVARTRPGSVPPFGEVVRRAMRTRSGQLGILLGWWWLGWHFVLST